MKVSTLNTSDYYNLQKALNELDTKKVARVGWTENARYNDKEQTPVAAVAAQNEFGNPTKKIPARPFMMPTINKNQNEWADLAEYGAKNIIAGRWTAQDALMSLGAHAAGAVKDTIASVFTPPLSPVTIQARLNRMSNKKTIGALDKPLIDTGHMLATLAYGVDDNG